MTVLPSGPDGALNIYVVPMLSGLSHRVVENRGTTSRGRESYQWHVHTGPDGRCLWPAPVVATARALRFRLELTCTVPETRAGYIAQEDRRRLYKRTVRAFMRKDTS